MESHIYVMRTSRVLIPTVSETDAGYRLEVEPVENILDPNVQSLAAALVRARTRGNPRVSAPSRKEFPRPVVLKPSGLRSWSRFDKEATFFRIIWEGEKATISAQSAVLTFPLEGSRSTLPLEEEIATYILANSGGAPR